jgi:hypothetical protein
MLGGVCFAREPESVVRVPLWKVWSNRALAGWCIASPCLL